MEKHIYIFKTENGSCKIGVSKNIEQRKKQYHVLEIAKLLIYSIHRSVLMLVLCQDLVQVKMRNFSPF